MQAWFWQLGLSFMFIPGLINLMVEIYRSCSCRGGVKGSWRQWVVWCAVMTPLYPLYVITNSIDTAVGTLRGKVTERIIENTKLAKLIEIIGESECCIKTNV